MIIRSVLDTEPLTYLFEAVWNGLPINPVSDPVAFAFMPNPANANPGVTDWHTGSWAGTVNGNYQAQIQVGPALTGVPLTVGLYNVWIKVTDTNLIPIRLINLLQII